MGLLTKNLDYPRELRGILIHYNPKKVVAGTCFSGIITTDGKLLTFGLGCYGQLGHLNQEKQIFDFLYIPKRVDYFDNYFVEDVSFGGSHALAIVRKKIKIAGSEEDFKLEDQRLAYSWGLNSLGQCGTGDLGQSVIPRKIEVLEDKNVLKVAAGRDHSLFVVEEEGKTKLYACGDASQGASGLTKSLKGKFSVPIHVISLDNKLKSKKVEGKDQPAKILAIETGMKTSFAIIESN